MSKFLGIKYIYMSKFNILLLSIRHLFLEIETDLTREIIKLDPDCGNISAFDIKRQAILGVYLQSFLVFFS